MIALPLGGLRTRFIVTALMLSSLSTTLAADTPPTSEQLEYFERQVRPLLVDHCYSCHSADAKKLQASLYVDSRAALLRGGDSGEAIVPGDVDGSLFMEAVRYESYEMPPKGKLSDAQIDVFAKWIEMGAPWPAGEESEAANQPEFDLRQRAKDHWVWQPIDNPTVPEVADDRWPKNAIDRFILSDLEGNGLAPAGDAEHLAILRRLYLDLIGLPPTAQQVEAFLADSSGKAIENVVDQLLESPHFGERWGRHWLDLVRYAESRGHEFDNDTPNAFQYRDYIIRALNADVSYDQLVREHLAGDLLSNPRLHPTEDFNESILGTGFWFLGEWVHSPVDIRKDEADRFDNMIDVMSKTFLGVTVSCARCHDHKFDAISTADYYSLSGFLQSSDYRLARFESMQQNGKVADEIAAVDAKYQQRIVELLSRRGLELPARSMLDDPSIVFDADSVAAGDFRQDGYIFGKGTRKAGQAFLTEDGSVSVATHSSAINDPIWHGLESVTEGQMQDRNALAKIPTSGRTLRLPTFELKEGRVSCLVSGAGHIIAVVDSHRLISGPLHGQTIRQVKGGERWVTLNLGRYVGHRLHLEFVPAKNEQLSVQLVTQGLDDGELRALDKKIESRDREFRAYAEKASQLFATQVSYDEVMFADFESGTYEGWTATGKAFGSGPQTLETIPDYQGKINRRGKFFVNSHDTRPGGDMMRGDDLVGKLTSREFLIDFDEVQFLIGGGSHAGKTCMNLLVDGKVVRSATGRNNNQMFVTRWDVSEFRGKNAILEVVDDHRGGWGNVGVDHVVFRAKVGPTRSADKEASELAGRWHDERQRLSQKLKRRSRVAMAMVDGSGEDGHVLIRGNSSKPGKLEPRHFLTAITGDDPMSIASGSGRLELAGQINSPTNPLTKRVIANRVWHYLMGRGIVPTTDDFGVLGQRPTNPALLDHLAVRFDQEGQSIKRLIRYIVLSRTYQMTSVAGNKGLAADPKNLLWHYRPPKRLEGEVIRDQLLQLSGELDSKMFGPAVPIHLTDFMTGRGRPGKSGPLDGAGRRSIYVSVRRNFLSPFMLAFDTPVPFSTMGRRNVSNVPSQALILMNDPFVSQQAKGWASRVLDQHSDQRNRIESMYLDAFGRKPTDSEWTVANGYIGGSSELDVWADFAHALINTKEFIFVR